MARQVKPGITFYRMDSGHIINKKVRLLFNECGSNGYYIWSCLVDYAYARNGYFFDLQMDPDDFDLFADEYCKMDKKVINKVVQACIKRDLFNANIASSQGILTSEMMQDCFIHASSERRKKGSKFEIPEQWLLVDFTNGVPLNITIIPGGRQLIPPGSYLQTIDNRQETKTRDLLGPVSTGLSDKTLIPVVVKKGSGGQDARRKIPDPPTMQEVEELFMKQYDPKNPGTWFPDRCKREAADFFDYYDGNGWVQGKSRKPIIKWTAAASKWIRTAKAGTFSDSIRPTPPDPVKVITTNDRTTPVNMMENDINFLYERFVEDQAKVTILSIEVSVYDYLKKRQAFDFSDEKVAEIKDMATKQMQKSGLDPAGPMLKTFMKKLAVIELFKVYQAANSPKIFKL
jgi:hypothetical protein